MAVKAYLLKKINVKNNDDEIIIERILENKPTFTLNNNERILKLFQESKGDNINEDLTGELTIDRKSWIILLNNILIEEFTPKERNIIKKITKDLKNNGIVFYECF